MGVDEASVQAKPDCSANNSADESSVEEPFWDVSSDDEPFFDDSSSIDDPFWDEQMVGKSGEKNYDIKITYPADKAAEAKKAAAVTGSALKSAIKKSVAKVAPKVEVGEIKAPEAIIEKKIVVVKKEDEKLKIDKEGIDKVEKKEQGKADESEKQKEKEREAVEKREQIKREEEKKQEEEKKEEKAKEKLEEAKEKTKAEVKK
eukprot:UN26574